MKTKTVTQIIAEANETIREVAKLREETRKIYDRVVSSEKALVEKVCSQLSEMGK